MSRTSSISLPQEFYEARLITGIDHVVKSGKEATVYCCRAHPATGAEFLAAKVYRPRQLRSFQNDAIYQQGRVVQAIDGVNENGANEIHVGTGRRNRRLQRAVQKKTRVGREVQFASWVCQEYQTLGRLSAAGADVPRPVDWSGSTILMEYIGDDRTPAPHLISVTLAPGEVRPLFERILRSVEIALACDLVHGDLSPFNVLYWNGGVKIIDFPQSVDIHSNSSAFALLERDVENICDYFADYGIRADPSRLARQFWRRALYCGL
jgi:RIO kinase 1